MEHNDISTFMKDHVEQTVLDWYWRFNGIRFGYGYNFIASVAKKYKPTVFGSLRKEGGRVMRVSYRLRIRWKRMI